MQLESDVRVFGGVFTGRLEWHLVEGNLLRALARYLLEGDGLDTEIFAG